MQNKRVVKMTKITRQSLRLRAKRLSNKLSVKRMKLTVCDECNSSSDDDHWPILPPTSSSSDSSNELSPIEEEEKSSESISTCSGSSKYHSSFLKSSVTTISSISDDESSYKPLNAEIITANNDPCPSNINFEDKTVKERENETQTDSAVVNIDDIGFESLTRQIAEEVEEANNSRRNRDNENDLPSYITLTPEICEFTDIHRSKNFTFLLMNFALVASNVNQLKYLMNSQEHLRFFYISLGLIIASCVFQFIAKTFSFVSYCFSLNTEHGIKRIKCLNTFIILFAFLTTVVNVGLSVVLLIEFNDILPL